MTGRLIATGSNDKLINIIVSPFLTESNIEDNGEVLEMSLKGHKSTVRTVLFDP